MKTTLISMLFFAYTSLLAANVWKNELPVNKIQSLSDGGFIIYLPAGTDNSCAENGKLFYVKNGENGQTLDGIKTTLAIALTAHSTGKKITLMYDNATNKCYVNTVVIN